MELVGLFGVEEDVGVDGGVVEDFDACKVNKEFGVGVFHEEAAQVFAIASAHPFVRSDIAEMTTGAQEVLSELVEEAVDVASAGKGLEAASFVALGQFAAVVLQLYVRRVANEYVEAAGALRGTEHVGKPGVPKEEVGVSLQVDAREVEVGLVGVELLVYAVVDAGEEVVLVAVAGGVVVLAEEVAQFAALVVEDGVEELERLRFGRQLQTVLGNAAEVDALILLEQGIALHDFEVEVGQGVRLVLVDHEGEPEAEAGNVDGTALNVDAVDVVLNDVALDGGGVVEVLDGAAAEKEFFEQAHGEGARTDCRVADAHGAQPLVDVGGQW